eukprot:s39_g25.t1
MSRSAALAEVTCDKVSALERVNDALTQGSPEEGPLVCSLLAKELEGTRFEHCWISQDGKGQYRLGEDGMKVAVQVLDGKLIIHGYFEGSLVHPVRVPIVTFLAEHGKTSQHEAFDDCDLFGATGGAKEAPRLSRSRSPKLKDDGLPPGWVKKESRSKPGVFYYANEETPTAYIMWRFAGNDDRESLEFKTDELSVDEEKARAAKWCIDSVTGNVRRCTDPKEDAKKAKQDEAGAVVPDAIVNRRQKKKEKTFEYEVKWQFKSMDQNTWVEKVFDDVHDRHVLTLVPQGQMITYCGYLDGGIGLFTILDCVFVQQFPHPHFVMTDKTKVLGHLQPSWDSLHRVIELCSGMGALGFGASAMGFQTTVGNDMNGKMASLFAAHTKIECVEGDIGQTDVIYSVWKQSAGAHVVTAGFSCQPFSAAGDQLGQHDNRSRSLTSVLAAGFFLQCFIMILECVKPAGSNEWVQQQLKHFCDVTGFEKTEVVLRLDDVWPAKRERWWCLLTSPLIGAIQVQPWPRLSSLPAVDHLIPQIRLWHVNDEEALHLTPEEMNAFGVNDGTHPKYLLNAKGHCPCVLHSLGSQLFPCPCGCRCSGLSAHRLSTKGLFGVLIRSAEDASGLSFIRHPHPCEIQALTGVDPVLDYGPHVKLTLTALGQLASPLQSLWLFAAVSERLNNFQFGKNDFSPLAHLQAYRSWLVMRSQMVWPCEADLIADADFAKLVSFWKDLPELSLDELMNSTRWEVIGIPFVSIGAILDFLIRTSPDSASHATEVPRPMPDVMDVDHEAPTPWMETITVDPALAIPEINCDSCEVAVVIPNEAPIVFTLSAGTKVADFLAAHANLTGCPFHAKAFLANGNEIDFSHVFQPGQTVCVHVTSLPWECGQLPIMPEDTETRGAFDASDINVPIPNPTVIDPTAEWTCPVHEHAQVDFNRQGPSIYDVGQISPSNTKAIENQSWVNAAPLLALRHDQFLRLPVPSVHDTKQLWSLRHQFIQACDRMQILHNQGDYMSDDEIRFHFAHLQHSAVEFRVKNSSNSRTLTVLDPLLATGFLHGPGAFCSHWANDHLEIPQGKADLITAFLLDGHWVPVYMTLVGDALMISTWDAPQSDHANMNRVLHHISQCFGFSHPIINRQQRLFFTSSLCGALSLSFLHNILLGYMMPTSHDDATVIHARLRAQFHAALQSCDTALRPWIWGAGDSSDASSVVPADSSLGPASLAPALGHTCVSVDGRLAIMEEHDLAFGDDEMRFHLNELIHAPPDFPRYGHGPHTTFVLLEPLLFETWPTVGKHLCQSWCRANLHLQSPEYNIVTAIVLHDHWLPLWFVPHGSTLQCHSLHNDISIDAELRPFLETIAFGLQFEELVFHIVPDHLPAHRLCGPLALAFLRHVMYGHWMPWSVDVLRDEHVEFRASFVAAMYTQATCICPTVWGWGTSSLLSELAFELVKHGVPPDRAEHRASQALKSIGSDPVQKALQSKQSWRQLKMLANQVKFQFILPEELSASIANNSKGDVNKVKKSTKALRVPQQPPELVLDPAKLQVMPGTFVSEGAPLMQLSAQQIGPVSSGFVLMSASDAEPYLRSGTLVSNEPLALVLFHGPGVHIQTALAQHDVDVPCRCTLNQEPILAKATIIQIGRGHVEKATQTPIELESLDVATMKVLVYRDELDVEWSEFISSPIRHLVTKCPSLRRCNESNCTCEAWHNEELLPVRDVLLDVWRRQFLKSSFKPEQASKADVFSVCIRLPACLMTKVLSFSGNSGIYVEARSPDGRDTLSDFAVVWTPKTTTQDLQHLRQTNAGVLGLVRIGDRRGLRVPASQASAIHALVRPDTMFLPVGPRKSYLAGPFPYGCDRQAISRALKKANWEAKPLQPSMPVQGKGNVWLVQAIEDPPSSVIPTSHGEVIITRQREEQTPKPLPQKPVGAAATLALCGEGPASKSLPQKAVDPDPWTKHDPWSSFRPSTEAGRGALQATESLKQLETRILDAVVEKLPTSAPMDEDVPNRLQVLEGQVAQLMTKHQSLEHNMAEFSNHQGQQIANLQSQITAQGQQFHGQLASQEQSIAAMRNTFLHTFLQVCADWPSDVAFSSRALLSATLIHDSWIQGGTMYGEPDGHLHPDHRIHNEALLQHVAGHICHLSKGYRFVAGDFNETLDSLPAFSILHNAGFRDLQTLALERFGRPIQMTCKQRTRKDFCFISPELQDLLLEVMVHTDIWPDHVVLQGRFASPRSSIPRMQWFQPSDFPWPSQFSVDPEFWQTADGDATARYAALWRHFESQATPQVPFAVPKRAYGRGQTLCPKATQISKQAPVRAPRKGEFAPHFHGASRKHVLWVRQVRRLQAFVGFRKSQSTRVPEQAAQMWNAIRFAKGFLPSFPVWWETCECQVSGAPRVCPDHPPDFATAIAISESMVMAARQLETQLIKESRQYARLRREQHPHAIFRDIRAPTRSGLDILTRSATARIASVDSTECCLHLDHAQDWSDQPILCNGNLLPVIHADADCIWVEDVNSVQVGAPVSQLQLSGTLPDLTAEFLNTWSQRWHRHKDIPADRWSDIVAFARQHLPAGQFQWPSLDVDSLQAAIRSKRSTTSGGLDGVTLADLKSLPVEALSNFCSMYHQAEQTGHWPSQVMIGRVSLIAKTDSPQSALDFRPITVLSLIYRCWSSHHAHVALRQLDDLLPPGLVGSRPNKYAGQIWSSLLWEIERSYADGTDLGGVVADIQKAFNYIPRLAVMEICAHIGLPAKLLLGWTGALVSMQRCFQLRDHLTEFLDSTTGVPEGCALSCLAMMVLDWSLHIWFQHMLPFARPLTFVDDWQVVTTDSSRIQAIMDGLFHFSGMIDMLLDERKTFSWSITSAGRASIRTQGFAVVSQSRNLGAHLQFTRQHTNSVQVERLQTLQTLWPRLRLSASPYRQKLHAVKMAAWPKGLHAIAATSISAQWFQTLRSGVMKGLQADGAGVNSHLHLGLVEHPMHDPQFWTILHTFRFLRDCACPASIEQMMADIVGGNHDIPDNSITSTLVMRLQLLGWHITSSGGICDLLGEFSFFQISFQELQERATQAWTQVVASEVVHRKGFSEGHRIHAAHTREWLRILSNSDAALFRKVLNGAHFTQDVVSFSQPESTTTCLYCECTDSRFHRFWQCKFFDSQRQTFPAHLWNLLPTLPEVLTSYGWLVLPPLDALPAAAVRWYGVELVQQLVSWFWQGLDPTAPVRWISHFQLYLDFQLSTGERGPVHFSRWENGSRIPLLGLRDVPFKKRTRWFTKVMKEILRHMHVPLETSFGRPFSEAVAMHTGVWAVSWPQHRLTLVDHWMISRLPSAVTRGGQALDSLPLAQRDGRFDEDTLVKMGYLKLVQREDERQAAMAGLMTKQLTQPGVEKHLADFGVDAESASHTQINQLSGGMKVKVVLAAAMWQNPHVLILDEPTNYLDREGLGALILAIKDYKGGVLIISHNKEFCDNVATEKWIMKGGLLRIEGESLDTSKDDAGASAGPDEVFDGAGNKIEVKKSVTMTEKDKKKAIKDIEKKIKDGKKKQTLTDEEVWELEDKLNELKESLNK